MAAVHFDPRKEPLLHELVKKFNPNWNSPQPSVAALKAGSTYLMAQVDRSVLQAHTVNQEHLSPHRRDRSKIVHGRADGVAR